MFKQYFIMTSGKELLIFGTKPENIIRLWEDRLITISPAGLQNRGVLPRHLAIRAAQQSSELLSQGHPNQEFWCLAGFSLRSRSCAGVAQGAVGVQECFQATNSGVRKYWPARETGKLLLLILQLLNFWWLCDAIRNNLDSRTTPSSPPPGGVI